MKKLGIFIIIGIILLLSIMGVIAYFLVVPQVIVKGGFTCPTDKYCTATPILKCTTPVADAKVILRTNAQNFIQDSFKSSGIWIAVDTDDDGSLEGYVKGTAVSSCLKDSASANNLFKSKGIGVDFIYTYNNKVYVCTSSSQAVVYESTSVAVTSISPTEPYKSNNQEKYGGNLYSCSKKIFSSGATAQLGELIWARDYPTPSDGLIGDTYSVQGGETLSTQGSGLIEFEYTINNAPITSCTTSDGQTINVGDKVCVSSSRLETCSNTQPPIIIVDERDPQGIARCINGVFQDAYSVDISIESLSISLGEKVVVNFDLDAPAGSTYQVSKRTVFAELRGSNLEDSDSQLTDSQGKVTFELEPDSTGFKELTLRMSHPEGDYNMPPVTINVGEPLTLSTYKTEDIQYDANDIQVVAESVINGQLTDMSDYQINAVYIKGGATSKVTPRSVQHLSASGIYKFNYKLEGDGNLRFQIKGQSPLGAWTEYTQFEEVEVKKTQIVFANVQLPFNDCQGSKKSQFELVDSSGNPIEGASVTVKLTDPNARVTNPAVTESGNGIYTFTTSYSTVGNYYVDMIATKGSIQGQSLNNPLNILGCGGGGDPNPINWTLWIFVGVLIVGIAFLFFLIFFRRKK